MHSHIFQVVYDLITTLHDKNQNLDERMVKIEHKSAIQHQMRKKRGAFPSTELTRRFNSLLRQEKRHIFAEI